VAVALACTGWAARTAIGKADHHVPDNPPTNYQSANATVIAHEKKAKTEVRFWYPTQASTRESP